MSNLAGELKRLHQLHLRLRETADELQKGPRQIKARKNLTAKRLEELEQAREIVKQRKMAADRKQLDLKTNESKIQDLQAKLNSASSNREYDAITGQIEADRVANSVLEDEILELFTAIDEAESAVKEREEVHKKAVAEEKDFEQKFQSVAGELESELATLREQIKEAEKSLPAKVAERYRRTVENKGADAMAAADGGVCTACYMQITPQNQILLRTDKPVFCSCGALLYMEAVATE